MENPSKPLTRFFDGCDFLESPRWHGGKLWLSDFYMNRVLAVDEQGHAEVITQLEGQPSGVGWLPDGRLLAVSMLHRKVMRLERDGSLVVHVDLSGLASHPCNDMVVDGAGRAYVGHFGFDLMGGDPFRRAGLVLVEPDGAVRQVADDLFFPNGMVVTPDGQTLLVNETFGNRVSAFPILSDGTLGDRRDWAVFGPLPKGDALAQVVPQLVVALDGAALDAQGCLWVADSIGNRVMRVQEGGHTLLEFSTGEWAAIACCLGGTDGRTLFVCVAPDAHAERRKGAGESAVLSAQVGIPGAPPSLPHSM